MRRKRLLVLGVPFACLVWLGGVPTRPCPGGG